MNNSVMTYSLSGFPIITFIIFFIIIVSVHCLLIYRAWKTKDKHFLPFEADLIFYSIMGILSIIILVLISFVIQAVNNQTIIYKYHTDINKEMFIDQQEIPCPRDVISHDENNEKEHHCYPVYMER